MGRDCIKMRWLSRCGLVVNSVHCNLSPKMANKLFLSGGKIAGGYFSIGTIKGAEALCIAEGFATGATIHQATGYPVAVAFNAGNLEPVAKAMRHKFPNLPMIICADDDANTEGNPGITKANLAALAIGAKVAIPIFGDQRPDDATDFNDMAALLGLEAVPKAINGRYRAKRG